MAAIAESPANHLLLYDVSWEAYSGVMAAFGERRLRHTYNEGTFEITAPLNVFEWRSKLIARLIGAYTFEHNIPTQSIGSTTLGSERVQKGLEPDDCYYLSHEEEVRGRLDYDPDRDPPPDLAIEIDVPYRSLNRMEVYAALRVPEIWRTTDHGVSFYRLNRSGQYSTIRRSRELSLFTPTLLDEYLALRGTMGETTIVRQFVAWVRSNKRKKST
jgi:Uma2 family endonuclease